MRGLVRALIRLLLVVMVVVTPIGIGFVRFVDSLPPPTDDRSHTDAIVVLTGGSDRVATGLALLEAGKGDRLFVSGVHPGVDAEELLRIDRNPVSPAPPDPGLARRMDLGDTAGDTFGNSVETVQWMRANRYRSMRLVTADYHMRRALIEFRMEAPDIRIVPNPVHPPGMDTQRWWRDRATFNLLLGEYGKYLIARWRYAVSRLTKAA
jgi:uncharacterized SAM-binding protein YcdF (DUF218 family)